MAPGAPLLAPVASGDPVVVEVGVFKAAEIVFTALGEVEILFAVEIGEKFVLGTELI